MKNINHNFVDIFVFTFFLLFPLLNLTHVNGMIKQNPSNYKVLIFSKTVDFRHDAIENGIQAIQKLGEENHFQVDQTEDTTLFNDQILQKYQTVIFLNTSGDVLNEAQQEAFKKYIQNGGGFVGVHGATATEYDWQWYGELVGTYFDQHPKIQRATVRITDRTHASTVDLPVIWERTDEWYNFRSKLNENVHVLAVMDEPTYSGGTHGDFHPFCWWQNYHGGRSWYTAGGHTKESYTDSLFLKHLLGGIMFAAGMDTNFYPDVLLMNSRAFVKLKRRIAAGEKSLLPALNKLRQEADQALISPIFSVMNKKVIPPSGDKHDYMSMGPYWWPNPKTKDGLPYIRRDGEVNPERNQFDKIPLRSLDLNVSTLALAYFLTDHAPYAEHAARLVRAWFLDDATRMNPNLNFGQAIPGRSQGRNVGIIESRSFFRIADAVRMLAGSKAWSQENQQEFEHWLKRYLYWLIESDLGRKEAAMENNHGTWYDVQVAYFALYAGEIEIAKEILAKFPERRIASQVDADGRQPLELKRTRAFSYSVMNLEGYFAAAQLGEKVGLDIWNFSTEDGRSIQQALDILIPYATKEKTWQYQQITSWEDSYEHFMALLRLASIKYNDERYERLIEKLPGENKESSRVNLVCSIQK